MVKTTTRADAPSPEKAPLGRAEKALSASLLGVGVVFVAPADVPFEGTVLKLSEMVVGIVPSTDASVFLLLKPMYRGRKK